MQRSIPIIAVSINFSKQISTMRIIKPAKENTHPLAVLTSRQKLFTTTITGLVCRLFWFLFQTVLQMCWDAMTNDRAKRSCPSNCRHRAEPNRARVTDRTNPFASSRHFVFCSSLSLSPVTLTLFVVRAPEAAERRVQASQQSY